MSTIEDFASLGELKAHIRESNLCGVCAKQDVCPVANAQWLLAVQYCERFVEVDEEVGEPDGR